MTETKKVYSVSLDPTVRDKAFKMTTYHGFKSFSELVEKLLADWISEKKI